VPVLCEGTSRMTRAASDCTSEHGKKYFDSRLNECFYEKVIKVKADVAALLCWISVFFVWHVSSTVPPILVFFTFLVLGGFCHISAENFPLGSLRSDDWQLGRPAGLPVLSVLP